MPTPLGLPYPDPTDPVSLGAADIRALAEALDALVAPIADKKLTATGPIVFSAIPQTFRHLRLVAQLRGINGTNFVSGAIRFNGDSGANYQVQRLRASGGAVSAFDAVNAAGIQWETSGSLVGAYPGIFVMDIPDYREASHPQTIHYSSGFNLGPSGLNGWALQYGFGIWGALAAVTEIELSLNPPNFAAGSRATLYGLP